MLGFEELFDNPEAFERQPEDIGLGLAVIVLDDQLVEDDL